MESKIVTTYYLRAVRVAIIKSIQQTANVGEDV
jgi:hypothetical protein